MSNTLKKIFYHWKLKDILKFVSSFIFRPKCSLIKVDAGSGALPGKIVLARIIKNDKSDAFRSG